MNINCIEILFGLFAPIWSEITKERKEKRKLDKEEQNEHMNVILLSCCAMRADGQSTKYEREKN